MVTGTSGRSDSPVHEIHPGGPRTPQSGHRAYATGTGSPSTAPTVRLARHWSGGPRGRTSSCATFPFPIFGRGPNLASDLAFSSTLNGRADSLVYRCQSCESVTSTLTECSGLNLLVQTSRRASSTTGTRSVARLTLTSTAVEPGASMLSRG